MMRVLIYALLLPGIWISFAEASDFRSRNSGDLTHIRYRVEPDQGQPFTLQYTLRNSDIQHQRAMLGDYTERNEYLQQLADDRLRQLTGTDGRAIFHRSRDRMLAIKERAVQAVPRFVIHIQAHETAYNWKLGYSIPSQVFTSSQHRTIQKYTSRLRQEFASYEQQASSYEAKVTQIRLDPAYKTSLYQRFDEKFFTDTSPRTRVVGVDYGRIAATSRQSLTGLAGAIRQLGHTDTRAVVSRVLTFMQSIPYDTLGSRQDSRAFLNGFFPPAVMLAENRGDCDIKSTTMASLLKLLQPELQVAIIVIPGHALLGVRIDPKPGDRLFRHQGQNFVLMEPVGPAFSPIGEISEQSQRSLQLHQIERVYVM